MREIIIFLIFLFLTSCCGPFVHLEKIDPEVTKKIKVYEGKEILQNKDIIILGTIEATSCQHLIWNPHASNKDCLDQLKMKASYLGANAVVLGHSEEGFADFIPRKGVNRNCWTTVDCSAVVIITKGGD